MKDSKAWIRHGKRRYAVVGVLVIIIAVVAVTAAMGFHHGGAQAAGGRGSSANSTASASRRGATTQVTVASVASLSPQNVPLQVIGDVTSLDQATILAQSAGQVTTLNKNIGDEVEAGETIATLDDSSQEAALLQAQGQYDVAEAALVKASGGTEGNADAAGPSNTSLSASYTQTAQAGALQSAYALLDDAVHTKADTLFNYPRSANPTLLSVFNVIPFDGVDGSSPVTAIDNERVSVEGVLARDQTLSAASASDADLTQNVGAMTADAQDVLSFLNNLASAVNELGATDESDSYSIVPQATVASYQSTVAAARTEVSSAIASLSSTENTYDTSADQADVEEYQGALDAAKAALAKTLITSPVSGTIVDLPITEGDYVTSGEEVAEVSNPEALKIVTHVSSGDAGTLSVGNVATVNDASVGTISSVAPAIDPNTGAVEVDVAVADASQAGLEDGDSVTVSLARNPETMSAQNSPEDAAASSSVSAIIPIVALKITPTGPEVFTVDPSTNILVAHPVSIGSILGQNIVVTSGLVPSLDIVTDARGLVAGEPVTIKSQ